MMFSIFILTLLTAPIIIGYFLDWNIDINYISYTISLFALASSTHFILQLIFSFLNRQRMDKIIIVNRDIIEKENIDKEMVEINIKEKDIKIGIQVTGWKEDSELFAKCLESVKKQSITPDIITFCSDGNDLSDEYMVEIFKDVFKDFDPQILRLKKTIKDMDELNWKLKLEGIKNNIYNSSINNKKNKLLNSNIVGNFQKQNPICIAITQPHKGKRYGIYSQMKIHLELEMDYLLLIDSDTYIKDNSLEMFSTTIKNNKADAVTGDVCIYNQVNLLSFLVSLKYWYAFNIERASQSFFGNVSCVAGPFGMYKCSTIKRVIKKWINQKFLNKECTFGDDRHLTNLILKEKGTIYYNHNAICYTDTPTELQRFITQQTRWGKSFVREYLLDLLWFHHSQFWLSYDLSFMAVYSLLLTGYIIYIFLKFNYLNIMVFISAILGATLIRALYAVVLTRELKHIIFILYSYIYLFLLIPIKLWAIFTINITYWGTGSRLKKKSKHIDLIPIILWNIFLLTCFIISLIKQINNGFSFQEWLFTGLSVGSTISVIFLYHIIWKK